jgi:tRNA(Arg) A34 adenosine deaminase TadA
MALPEIALESTLYLPNDGFKPVETQLSSFDEHLMGLCFDLAEMALSEGNPPVGAQLYSSRTGQTWGAKTIDKTNRRLMGHGEVRAYNDAAESLGDDLSDCTLITTSEPCVTCTAPYAEGQIGRIIFAAPRPAIRQVSGLMRSRNINMHDLLVDGNTRTVVTSGYQAERALALFSTWGELCRQGKVKT